MTSVQMTLISHCVGNPKEDRRTYCFQSLHQYVVAHAVESMVEVHLFQQLIIRSLMVGYISLHRVQNYFNPCRYAYVEYAWSQPCRNVFTNDLQGLLACKSHLLALEYWLGWRRLGRVEDLKLRLVRKDVEGPVMYKHFVTSPHVNTSSLLVCVPLDGSSWAAWVHIMGAPCTTCKQRT